MPDRLPNRLIPIKNADKAFHEKWNQKRNILNFPHPWRAVLMGPPNVGKSTTIKNMILRANPPFESIICIHCDYENTKEWDDVGAEMLGSIPAPEEWAGEVKSLVILDDIEMKGMSKDQKANLDRLFGYVSTHKHVSVALTSQDPFNIPPIVRRCSNLWVLWASVDMDAMACVSRKSGLPADSMKSIFGTIMPEPHDSLWIDMTSKSPAPLRKNGFSVLKKNN
jgi:hypothetical protein